jgi:hypothetical protein
MMLGVGGQRWPQSTQTIIDCVGDFLIPKFGPTEPWLSCTASGNNWEFEAQTIRIDGGAIEEEIHMDWGVSEWWLVQTLLRLQWR